MDIGITLPTVGPPGEREYLMPLARAAERLGFHSVWVHDHVVFPRERRSAYPFERSTTGAMLHAGVDWLDPVATMGFLAGCTERIRIGSSVMVLPYRNPLIVANEVGTLDRLADGRIDLGVGAGWMDEEFEALGVPKRERGPRTDEGIEVLKTLWRRPEPVSFQGRFWSFRDVQLASRPVQPGGPPVLVGGNTEAALRRAGRLGDGWIGFDVYPEEAAASSEAIRRHAEEAGRDPTSLHLSVRRGLVPPFEVTNFLPGRRSLSGSGPEVAAELRRYAEAGIGLVVLDLAMLPDETTATMEWVAAELAPLVAEG